MPYATILEKERHRIGQVLHRKILFPIPIPIGASKPMKTKLTAGAMRCFFKATNSKCHTPTLVMKSYHWLSLASSSYLVLGSPLHKS